MNAVLQPKTGRSDVSSSDGGHHAQFLTFVCDGQEYGVEILRVQEVKGWERVSRIPQSAQHVLGVINLRGTIVPVIDLRSRLGLSAREIDSATVVVVVRVGSGHGATVGLVADAVSEVYSLDPEQRSPPPTTHAGSDPHCISEIATVDGKMILLLDIERTVSVV
jgi:purine-binding chemotaxis protein CheW